MAARETTVNIRASNEEKQLWKQHAPNGKLSAWIRSLIAKEIRDLK